MDHLHVQQIIKYKATHYTTAAPKIHAGSTLILPGIHVDTISAVGDLLKTVLNEDIPSERKTFQQ